MTRHPESRYIVLQESIPASEHQKMERALAAVLLRVPPAKTFVERLGDALIAEAGLRYARYQQHRQTLRMLSVIGGSVLSIVGGVLVWSVAHRRRDSARGMRLAGSHTHATVSTGSA